MSRLCQLCWSTQVLCIALILNLIFSNILFAETTIMGVTSSVPSGHYSAGKVLSVDVWFDNKVHITGSPYIELETGANNYNAPYVSTQVLSSIGPTVAYFKYKVRPGDATLDLNYTTKYALKLNGGDIRDANNQSVNLKLPETSHVLSLGGNMNISVGGVLSYDLDKMSLALRNFRPSSAGVGKIIATPNRVYYASHGHVLGVLNKKAAHASMVYGSVDLAEPSKFQYLDIDETRDLAVVGSGGYELYFFDTKLPVRPQLVSKLSLLHQVSSFKNPLIIGDVLYGTASNKGLAVVSISDVENPQFMETVLMPGASNTIYHLERYDSKRFLARTADGKIYFCTSNGSASQHSLQCSLGLEGVLGGPLLVTKVGTKKFLVLTSLATDQLKVYDISGFQVNSQTADISLPYDHIGAIASYANRVYVSGINGNTNALYAYILKQNGIIEFERSYPLLTRAHHLAIDEGYIYTAGEQSTNPLQIIIKSTGAPLVTNLSDSFDKRHLTVGDNGIVAALVDPAYNQTSLKVMKVDDIGWPTDVAEIKNTSFKFIEHVQGDYYLASGGFSSSSPKTTFWTLKIDKQGNITPLGTTQTKSFASSIVYDKDRKIALVRDSAHGIAVIDVANPSDPKRITNYSDLGCIQDIFYKAPYAYLYNTKQQIGIVDFSTPSSPILKSISSYAESYSFSCAKVSFANGYLYANCGGGDIGIWDVRNISNIKYLRNLSLYSSIDYLVAAKNALFVSCVGSSAYDIKAYDVSDPANPVFKFSSTATRLAELGKMFMKGNTLYTECELEGSIFCELELVHGAN